MTPRPLTLADLWLPGSALDGALLRGWTGPALVKCIIMDDDGNDVWEGGICAGGHASNGFRGRDECRLDLTRPEVRDRAVRILGPDLLPIHAAEIRKDITPGEAAGLAWCSVLRREAGMGVVLGWHGEWRRCGPAGVPVRHERWERGRSRRDLAPPMVTGTTRQVLTYRELADDDALGSGLALRESGGILLLPLPEGVIGRLETSNG